MAKPTFKSVSANLLAALPGILSTWLPGGKVVGNEYKSKNPTRNDAHEGAFSVNCRNGKWADFADGAKGGDLISLYAYLHGLSQGEALNELAGVKVSEGAAAPAVETDEWSQIVPVPDDVSDPVCKHFKYGPASAVWFYYTENGGLIGAVARFDQPNGKKDVMPMCYCLNRKSNQHQWRWRHFDKPRPIYNLDKLHDNPTAPVWIVEGEKCAEAMEKLMPSCVATTWPGGAKAVKTADWKPLIGREVFIWPDNDEPGMKAKSNLYEVLKNKAAKISHYIPPGSAPSGWDVADAVKEGITLDAVMVATAEMKDPPKEGKAAVTTPAPVTVEESDEWPFKLLGYDHSDYYYQSHMQKQVIALPAAGHTKSGLLMLAPLSFWEATFPSKTGPDWVQAMDFLIQKQISPDGPGPYDPAMVHGRGVCWDSGRVVTHVGDKLLVDGADCSPSKIKSKFIYESRPRLGLTESSALTPNEASKFYELATKLSWERPIYATYFAGWCALAPVCGALKWRPHIWNTGSAGSGKSWVMDHIVSRLLSAWCLHAMGGVTTEAGIRHKLFNDALPIMIDECEQEDQKQAERTASILFLMRQASSESGAQAVKGSATGRPITYNIRSMFYFSSISVGSKYHADNSRIAVITMKEDHDKKRFDDIKEFAASLITPEFCDRFIKRSISQLRTIRTNAETFSDAVSDVMKSKRTGDQIGALLAGKWSLMSDALITPEEARKVVMAEDWSEETVKLESKDEISCLKHILQISTRIQMEKAHIDRNIGEMVAVSAGEPDPDNEMTRKIADTHLARMGLRVDTGDGMVYISNSSRHIQAGIKDTPWTTGYARQLKRIKNSIASNIAMRFNAGLVSRYIAIPISTVLDDEACLGAEDDGKTDQADSTPPIDGRGESGYQQTDLY